MKQIVDCPFCDGKAHINTEPSEIVMHGEKIPYDQLYYKCDECGEGFTTNSLDEICLKQLYDEYEKRHPEWKHRYN